jgi:hypothetical protein
VKDAIRVNETGNNETWATVDELVSALDSPVPLEAHEARE